MCWVWTRFSGKNTGSFLWLITFYCEITWRSKVAAFQKGQIQRKWPLIKNIKKWKRSNTVKKMYSTKGTYHLAGFCTPDIRILRISAGYQRYNKRISGEDWPNFKYLTDFSRIFKNISWIYLNISQILVDSGKRAYNLKNCWKQPCFDLMQQPHINRISAGYQRFLYTGYNELLPLGTPCSRDQHRYKHSEKKSLSFNPFKKGGGEYTKWNKANRL